MVPVRSTDAGSVEVGSLRLFVGHGGSPSNGLGSGERVTLVGSTSPAGWVESRSHPPSSGPVPLPCGAGVSIALRARPTSRVTGTASTRMKRLATRFVTTAGRVLQHLPPVGEGSMRRDGLCLDRIRACQGPVIRSTGVFSPREVRGNEARVRIDAGSNTRHNAPTQPRLAGRQGCDTANHRIAAGQSSTRSSVPANAS